MTAKIIGGMLRTLLAAGGGLGFALSDNEVEQVASGAAILVTGIWSAWQKYQAERQQSVSLR